MKEKRRAFVGFFVASALWMLTADPNEARELSHEERIRAQEAIERVYYAHQVGAARPFREAVPRAVLEKKVRSCLMQSIALGTYWNTPITAQMLRQEVKRMAAQTRMPERLRELSEALGNDPFLIEEALARPALADRLSRTLYAHDATIHAKARREAEALRADLVHGRLDPRLEHPRRRVVDLTRAEWEGDRLGTREGEIGGLEEEREAFVTRVVLGSTPDEVRVAAFVVPKVPWDAWWASVEGGLAEAASEETLVSEESPLRILQPGPSGTEPGTNCPVPWAAVSLDGAPAARAGHTAVWTGNVMVVWGGGTSAGQLVTGGRYNPAIDTWSPTSTTNAPSPRSGYTTVWTGSAMVVWGGFAGGFLNTGGRYDPITDSWGAVSITNAPAARLSHAAVWTGTHMIVWGGRADYPGGELGTGGRYDPASDTWAPMSTGPAIANHTAVWTGTEMIAWGGGVFDHYDCPDIGPCTIPVYSIRDFGYRYNPSTDTWAPLANSGAYSPFPRADHIAVWTGIEMIVWGGGDLCCNANDNGDRYDPGTETWAPVSSTRAPAGRYGASAVWTGSSLIVWGGWTGYGIGLNTGHRYDPVTDTWTYTSTDDAPAARGGHSAVWTGTRMVVWGGSGSIYLESGGAYTVADPSTDDDGDGYTECQGDCFEGNPTVYPAAFELCDDLDNNCDGSIDGFPTFCGIGQCARNGVCTGGVDSCSPGAPSPEVCDGLDNNCDHIVDNAPVPVGSPSLELARFGQTDVLGWDALPDATRYDVVRGDLGLLRGTGGNFTVVIQACLANDLTDTALVLSGSPLPELGFVYLVRGTNCGGAGTYDSGSPAQVGSRNGEIGASPNRCP